MNDDAVICALMEGEIYCKSKSAARFLLIAHERYLPWVF